MPTCVGAATSGGLPTPKGAVGGAAAAGFGVARGAASQTFGSAGTAFSLLASAAPSRVAPSFLRGCASAPRLRSAMLRRAPCRKRLLAVFLERFEKLFGQTDSARNKRDGPPRAYNTRDQYPFAGGT